jgi:hypothetical protein
MPKPDPPAWKSAVDRVDRVVSPKADAFVRTNAFADAVGAMIRLESQVRRRMERQTSRIWHMWNLPTAGDIRRVRAQLSAVEARLRDMSERLEETEEARRPNGTAPRQAPARTRSAKRTSD